MSQFHSLFPDAESQKQQGKEDSTVKTAAAISRAVFHHELTPQQKKTAGPVVHYGFGASMAAIYGAAVEFAPRLRTGWGIPFGVAVWLGAHVITVPALSLSAPVTQSRPEEEAVEFGGHLVYGAIAEGLRRFLRTYLIV
jgi:putative membrane protein